MPKLQNSAKKSTKKHKNAKKNLRKYIKIPKNAK